MSKLKSLVRRPVWLVIGVVVLGVVITLIVGRGGGPELQTTTVGRGTVTQEVSVTGKVEPVESVQLSFERSGRVARVLAKVGDVVAAGTLLAELDRAELAAGLLEAEAQAKSQRAELEELQRGSRPEEIEIKRAELRTALQGLANEYAAVPDAVNDAYAKADDALRSKTSQLFTNEESGAPKLSFLVDGAQVEWNAQTSRQSARDEVLEWQNELPQLVGAGSSALVDELIVKAKEHLMTVRDSLARALDAVNRAIGVSATTLDTYRTNIGTARTNVNTGLEGVNDAEQAIAAQKIVVQRVQHELDLALAGTTPEQIAAQEALVEQAEASAQAARAQLLKTRLVSPIGGVVTTQDAKVGEIIAANVVVAKVISEKKFQIKADIPEADIAKISLQDPARVTLDAYGNSVPFEATVVKIDPAETVIEGVSTYRTTLEFLAEDDRIKSGMTANIDIMTEQHENALVLPQWAVTTKDGERSVRVRRGGALETVVVKTGLRGSDGTIEILSGVNEGDTVVVETVK